MWIIFVKKYTSGTSMSRNVKFRIYANWLGFPVKGRLMVMLQGCFPFVWVIQTMFTPCSHIKTMKVRLLRLIILFINLKLCLRRKVTYLINPIESLNLAYIVKSTQVRRHNKNWNVRTTTVASYKIDCSAYLTFV